MAYEDLKTTGAFGGQFFSDRAIVDRVTKKRDKHPKGSPDWNRHQNRINKIMGDTTKHVSGSKSDYEMSYAPGNPTSIQDLKRTKADGVNYGDTGKFNVSDHGDVIKMQQQLVKQGLLAPTYTDSEGNEVSSIDGQFGPMTQKAYRNMMDTSRAQSGEDAYTYGGQDDARITQGLLSEGYDNTQLDAIAGGKKADVPPFLGGEGDSASGYTNPEMEEVVNKRIAENESAGVYSGDEPPSIGQALSDTMSGYKDLGSDVYDYFSSYWNNEENK